MKEINRHLQNALENVVSGDPWFGVSLMKILRRATDAHVEQRLGEAHTQAELLLHMIAWTEEVTDRMRGKPAGEPSRGDWPDPSGRTWQDLIRLFENAHQELQATIGQFPEDKWDTPVKDTREEKSSPVSYRNLIEGLIQHHIYHVGQVALLDKQLNA